MENLYDAIACIERHVEQTTDAKQAVIEELFSLDPAATFEQLVGIEKVKEQEHREAALRGLLAEVRVERRRTMTRTEP